VPLAGSGGPTGVGRGAGVGCAVAGVAGGIVDGPGDGGGPGVAEGNESDGAGLGWSAGDGAGVAAPIRLAVASRSPAARFVCAPSVRVACEPVHSNHAAAIATIVTTAAPSAIG